jgi:hypothetical protein
MGTLESNPASNVCYGFTNNFRDTDPHVWIVATQISLLKRELYVIQKENKLMRKKLK